MLRLDSRCEMGVLADASDGVQAHEDLGCGLQGPTSRSIRRALDPLRRRIQRLGEAKALAKAGELCAWLEAQPAYDALCTSRREKGRRVIKPSVLYPANPPEPRVLQVRHGRSGLDVQAFNYEVGADDSWRGVHELTNALSMGVDFDEARRMAMKGGHEELLGALVEAGWATELEDDRAPPEVRGEGIFFVGHNCVLVASKKARVLVDPWFRPWRDADPADYRPVRPCDVGEVDAILITHSHGDHFHLGSLLAFPRETLILVPAVERESILSTNLAARLRQVGFTNVKALEWWSTTRVRDIEIGAMPFYGEQACAIDLVDPDLRNFGNTWFVKTPAFSASFLADTGSDPAGNMIDVALEARRRWGGADFVFSGIRGFTLAPLFLPFTSIDAMFVNVPLELLSVPMPLMHDARELIRVAQVFGARWAVPYADGGAPWYWREGMGPAYAGYPGYPGEKEPALVSAEDPKSAPFPERLIEASRVMHGDRSPVEPLVLRPGDLVRLRGGRVAVGRVEGLAWPYGDDDEVVLGSASNRA